MWLNSQVEHTIRNISVLLGREMLVQTPIGSKTEIVNRSFTDEERGVLNIALAPLYEQVDPYGPPAAMPQLTDVIDALERLPEEEARQLARTLRMALFGSSTSTARITAKGKAFNGVTTVDWSLRHDVNCFDLSTIEKTVPQWAHLYYGQLISYLYRDMRHPLRDRSRPTLVIIDEFGLAARVESVAQLAAMMFKVARKFGYAVVCVDQDPGTFLNSAHGNSILNQAAGRILFHLDDLPASQIGAAISDLSPVHIDYLTRAGRGKCVAVFGNTVYAMAVQANRQEALKLAGS
jgi:hypothetical protein